MGPQHTPSQSRRYVIPLDTDAALVNTVASRPLDPATLTEVSGYSSRDSRLLTFLLSRKHVAAIAEILNVYYSRTFLNHTCMATALSHHPVFGSRRPDLRLSLLVLFPPRFSELTFAGLVCHKDHRFCALRT